MRGAYASLQLVDAASGVPLTAYSVPSRPATERWVRCEWHKAFQIRCENLTGEGIIFKVYVDGVKVTARHVSARQVYLLKDVLVGTIKVRRKTKQLRKPLVFAQPSFAAAEGEEGGREGPRAGIEKLGRVVVKVNKVKRVRPRLVGRVTQTLEEYETTKEQSRNKEQQE